MIEYPVEGSAANNKANVMAIPFAQDYARMAGIPYDQAIRTLRDVGAVMQDRLVRGLPCGVPFVGTIYVHYMRDRKIHMSGLTKVPWNKSGEQDVVFPLFPVLRFWCSPFIAGFIRDNAPYTGTFDDHYKKSKVSEAEIRAMRKLQAKNKKKRKHEKRRLEAKRPNPVGNPEWRRRKMERLKKQGLMVEDANALECTDGKKDTIVKTGNRKETAQKLKESKGSKKPLHD